MQGVKKRNDFEIHPSQSYRPISSAEMPSPPCHSPIGQLFNKPMSSLLSSSKPHPPTTGDRLSNNHSQSPNTPPPSASLKKMSSIAFVPTLSASLTRSKALTNLTTPLLPTVTTPYPQTVPLTPIQTPHSSPQSPANRPKRILLWFHTDLRLHDNPALTTALRTATLPGGALVPVTAHLPSVHPLIAELRARVQQAGSDLLLLANTSANALIEICERLSLTAVYYNSSTDPAKVAYEKRVTNALESAGIRVQSFSGNMLPLDDSIHAKKQPSMRDVYHAVKRDAAEYIAPPERLPALPTAAAGVKKVTLVAKMGGGTSAALGMLTKLDRGRETLVLSRAADTAVLLKTHLDYGSVSPRMVAAAVKAVMKRLSGRTFSELVWRTHVGVIANRAAGTKVKAVA